MIDDFLIGHPWVALGIWVVVYVADYYLTLWGATLYKRTVSAFIDGGSYELELEFRADIDSLRRFSPRFLWYLILSSIAFMFVWWLAVPYAHLPDLFLISFGAYVLTEVVVHFRHVRNILMFRSMATPGAVEGHIKYARWVTERTSAVDLVCFGVFFAICYVLSDRIMFLGGAFGCLASAQRHFRQARRPVKNV